ncbi:MAG: MBL fold metallo-hydrolase [Oscillospiraceae bacterium]
MGKKGILSKIFKMLTAILLFSAVLILMWLCYKVYMQKSIGWEDVYGAFGLTPGVAVSEEKPGETTGDFAPGQPVSVTFLEAEQGDCCVIEAGESVVVIDAGEYNSWDEIDAFLSEKKIEKIDYLIATHPHADHIGSMRAVILKYEIGTIFFADIPEELFPTNSTYINLLLAIKQKNLGVEIVRAPERIDLNLGALTVISSGGAANLNDCSLVLRYDYGDTSFLFAGDIGESVEKRLVSEKARLGCNVLKAAHHGSKYSSCETFLDYASPDFVVMSCGLDNKFSYPNAEVLERCAKIGAVVKRTDLDGRVSFSSDGALVTLVNNLSKAA